METFSALLAICAGNSPVPGDFPTQRPVTRSFDVFFDLRLNKRLSKQSWGLWFETLSRPLWRHRNGHSSNGMIVPGPVKWPERMRKNWPLPYQSKPRQSVNVVHISCDILHELRGSKSIRQLWYQKQVSQAGISNCIPKYSVVCNYLSLPEIPASGAIILIYTRTHRFICSPSVKHSGAKTGKFP